MLELATERVIQIIFKPEFLLHNFISGYVKFHVGGKNCEKTNNDILAIFLKPVISVNF